MLNPSKTSVDTGAVSVASEPLDLARTDARYEILKAGI